MKVSSQYRPHVDIEIAERVDMERVAWQEHRGRGMFFDDRRS